MLDRKMYFSAAVLMIAALFLFQLSGVSKQAFSDYTKNRFAEEEAHEAQSPSEEDFFDPLAGGAGGDRNGSNRSGENPGADGTVVWIGGNGSVYQAVLQWCTYRRYWLVSGKDGMDAAQTAGAVPAMILLEGSEYEMHRDEVSAAVQGSIPVIFCGLPSRTVIEGDATLRELLGIEEVRGDVVLDGVQLRDGFLLGGAKNYVLDEDADEEERQNQDLDLSASWYVLGSGTEVYMAGILSSSTYGDVLAQYLPPLVWRHSTSTGSFSGNMEESAEETTLSFSGGQKTKALSSAVFAVSDAYLQDETALGILTAIESKTKDYALYPVINAQGFVLTDFPSLSSENEERMMELYSRNTQSVVRDIVWPGIETILDRTAAVPTYMIVPFLEDSSAVRADYLDDYMQRIRETRGEAGISLRVSAGLPAQTLLSDEAILRNGMPDYSFNTVYGRSFGTDTVGKALEDANAAQVTSILLDRRENGTDLLGVYRNTDGSGYRAVLRNVGTADTHTFSEDLRMRSVETCLGYSMLSEDLGKVLYPESEEEEWQNLSEKVSGNTVHYWDGFETFEKTSLSESGNRCLNYLTGRASSAREGDTIRISKTGNGTSYFVLRLYGEEIESAEGGSFETIEDGSWLVTMDGTEMSLVIRGTELQ